MAGHRLVFVIEKTGPSEIRAEWVKDYLVSTFGGKYTVYRCSKCYQISASKYDFCPSCGKEMEKNK